MPCRAERVVSEEVTSKRINLQALADSEAAEVTASACATMIYNTVLDCAVPNIDRHSTTARAARERSPKSELRTQLDTCAPRAA